MTQDPKLIEREEKPREFRNVTSVQFITDLAEYRVSTPLLHLIEKSALTALEHKLEVAMQALEQFAADEMWQEPEDSDYETGYFPPRGIHPQELAKQTIATIKGAKTDE